MNMEDYLAAPGISKSKLDLIHRSPAHYQQEILAPTPPTSAMVWGGMFHMFVLERDLFDATYALLPEGIDRRTKEGKTAWSHWQAENEDRIPIDKPSLAELTTMRDAIYAHPRASAALADGYPEDSMFWKHHTGTLCKGRADYITNDGLIVDIKTTVDARLDEFARSCWKFRYHVQAAFYLDGYSTIYKHQEPLGFLMIAVEKSPPYAVACYIANPEMVDQGRDEYLNDLAIYEQCVAENHWPGYPEQIQSIMLPTWAQERTYG